MSDNFAGTDRRKKTADESMLVPYLESMQENFSRLHDDVREGFKENREGLIAVHRRISDNYDKVEVSLEKHAENDTTSFKSLNDRISKMEDINKRFVWTGGAVVAIAGIWWKFGDYVSNARKALGW